MCADAVRLAGRIVLGHSASQIHQSLTCARLEAIEIDAHPLGQVRVIGNSDYLSDPFAELGLGLVQVDQWLTPVGGVEDHHSAWQQSAEPVRVTSAVVDRRR